MLLHFRLLAGFCALSALKRLLIFGLLLSYGDTNLAARWSDFREPGKVCFRNLPYPPHANCDG